MTTTPAPLKKGDKIALIATAKHFDSAHLEYPIETINGRGYEVVLGNSLLNKHHQMAGTDSERKEDFIWALSEEDIKAVWCFRGGYGTMRMLQQVNLRTLLNNPKWLLGYSDVTVLLAALHGEQVNAVHATMPISFKESTSEAMDSAFNILEGKSIEYTFPISSYNRGEHFTGELIAGNLSILMSLSGTSYDYDYHNKVLVIEDLCENKYHVDRMLLSLKMQGKFAHLKGVLVGGFTDLTDNEIPFGSKVEEMILEHVPAHIPVAFNFPLGHFEDNRSVVIGKDCVVNTSGNNVSFVQN